MRTLFNDQWQFCKVQPDTPWASVRETDWQKISLPHDWMILQADDLYETCDGLYCRSLTVGAADLRDCWQLRFDGAYMDCDVALNGELLCTHRYGYTAFDADLSGRLREGENLLTVRVRYRSPNSRWYSGAGIFRDVTLVHVPQAHLVTDGVYATPRRGERGVWGLAVRAETAGAEGARVRFTLRDAKGETVASAEAAAVDHLAEADLAVAFPRLWSPQEPNVYTLETAMDGDCLTGNLGFREAVFSPEEGLLLNGEPVKLHGVCLHHDLGVLGSAFHVKAARRQLQLMKDMGVNALRTSHNPPAQPLLDLCDEMGIMVVDEAFDMWQRPKTTYDYARFFDDCAEADIASWVRRDRNHPSVIMWSLGNEIYDTFINPDCPALVEKMMAWVLRHDPEQHARCTIGSNYMPWEGAQKCADIVKVAGYNYAEKYYDQHHAEHPDWVIYGSETASFLASRGIYHFPYDTNILSEEDLQCSALGNTSTSWGGKSLDQLIVADKKCGFSMGQFLWSGIDYIGEPTPYHTRCCYFGQADTACFPKDSFYRFQAGWTEKPMAHIGVTWDWNAGQLIDVPVYTNCAGAELFLNGVSLGRRDVDPLDEEKNTPVWKVPFQPGVLQVKAYDADGHLRAQAMRCTPGEPAALKLTASERHLRADGRDLVFLTVEAVDAQGLPVENACDRVWLRVEGTAYLLGVDNGDSTDTDGFRQDSRCLFSGKLLAVVGMAARPGETRVTVEAEGLASASVTLTAEEAETVFDAVPPRIAAIPREARPLARRVDLRAQGSCALTPALPSVDFTAAVCPAPTGERVVYRIVNAAGIPSPNAEAEEIPGGVRVTGRGDGLVYLRATLTNGAAQTRVISTMEVTMAGFGSANLDPYGFVAAGLYDLSDGEIGAGNEQGIAFARDGDSMVGFTHVDFGPVGSDEMTLPIFALSGDRYEIDLWLGDPREGGRKLTTLSYQKPSIWNTYQPETYTLPERLTGVQTLCFSMNQKVHLKGFSFTKQSRAWRVLCAGEADEIYGDDFTRAGDAVRGIGNNVTLHFADMDFGEGGAVKLTLTGATALETCAVNVRVTDAAGSQSTQMCGFRGAGGADQTFRLTVPAGVCQVDFVFLPGAQFDFERFQFAREG